MGKGQKLWKKAKKIIPGGNMLLSKRSELFLPDMWPSYFSKAKGCYVWDLDGNKFIDMSIMGIGTNTLGYGNDKVDSAVKNAVNQGNMSTFNCPEEVQLAEKLLDMHPWADMARFARSGGEANAIAIRIARAASGKDNVAICGYHGWHDWYLAGNLGNSEDAKDLDTHILPGLEPKGVPSNLRGTIFPFDYNNFEMLESIIKENSIGVVKMEVVRNNPPVNNFLQKVRELTKKLGIILVFDECTSGFRQAYGGIHKIFEVEPDMAIFGKALGNGYAITSIIGRREIMEHAQSTFISSTFWTERIGPTAACKTLEIMDEEKSWDVITKIGSNITDKWNKLANEHNIDITTCGIPAIATLIFNSKNNLAYKTLISQEMLKKGFLASNLIFVCTEHKPEIIEKYFTELEPIFSKIKKCETGELNILDLLDGPICHSSFKRLN